MPDTLQDFEIARAERFGDGLVLSWDGRPEGGLYMLGYHAEMTLKCAYFRWTGLRLSDPIRSGKGYELWTADTRAKVLGVGTPSEHYHSVRFWRDLLIADRSARARSFPAQIAADLTAHVDTVYSLWRVEMRYRTPTTTQTQVESATAAVDWLDVNYVSLYT